MKISNIHSTIHSTVQPFASDIHNSSKRMLPYWIGAAITALVSVFYAYIFGWSEELATKWFNINPALGFILVPTALVISSLLAQTFSPSAAGSGIPQLLAAVEVSNTPNPLVEKLLNFKMIIFKILGSCICVAGGGVSGREGPMLHVSAGIFRLLQKFWPKFGDKLTAPNLQSMILAGGAAGLASAFNTPLGGVVFAVEELAKVHISQIRTYVFHAVIIAGILAQAFLGNYLYFGKIQLAGPSTFEIIPLIFASALIGILGALFGSAIVSMMDLRARSTKYIKIISTAFFGLLVATIIYFHGHSALGSGRAVIVDLLTHPESPASFSLAAARAFGNLFTYAGGTVGGVFAPALSTGAALGGWLSHFASNFDTQLWILAGMVAFLTGVTRTPFTSLILVLEMTDTHNVIIYLMLAAVIAQSAAKLVTVTSFYEHMSYRIIHGKAPDTAIQHD